MRYPLTCLHPNILDALTKEFKAQDRRFKVPWSAAISPASSYAYYVPGEASKIACVLLVSLNKAEAGKAYTAYWGSYHGDINGDNHTVPGEVNTDKTLREIPPGFAVVKAIINAANWFETEVSVQFHPKDMPPSLRDLDLSNRERKILFVIAGVKNRADREIAFYRLNISPDEIQTLISKKAIRPSGKGWKLTLSAHAAKSEIYTNDQW